MVLPNTIAVSAPHATASGDCGTGSPVTSSTGTTPQVKSQAASDQGLIPASRSRPITR